MNVSGKRNCTGVARAHCIYETKTRYNTVIIKKVSKYSTTRENSLPVIEFELSRIQFM